MKVIGEPPAGTESSLLHPIAVKAMRAIANTLFFIRFIELNYSQIPSTYCPASTPRSTTTRRSREFNPLIVEETV